MFTDKKNVENENDKMLAEKMRIRLHQSYNIECPKCISKEKNASCESKTL